MSTLETAEPTQLRGGALWAVFSGLMLVMLLAALDATIVATALPTVARDLGGLDHISWVTTAYLLAETVVTPLYGKLGDLFGRRIVLQVGLVIFLAGSALCGLSHSFTELVIFRAIQGLGGGGLMVSSQAAIADVVSPRERGKYQGLFGAVFGIATVAGPLIGGWLTTSLSWRWVFYVNLPIGVVALVVLSLTFRSGARRADVRVDYLGTATLAIGLASLTLMLSLAGTTFAWLSVQTFVFAAVTVLALSAFALIEVRAEEPVLPPHLFTNRVFASAGVVALLVGFAMFGAITFLPLYFQVVKGATPTVSGLELLPMMAGLLLTSIVGGQLVTRTGRYRIFPIAGTGVMTVGLFLLSRLMPGTSTATAAIFMFITGFGIGLVMQVLVVAVQNAVSYDELGVATSGNTLLRNIGSSTGTAIIGTIFATQLAKNLEKAFPNAPQLVNGARGMSSAALEKLPAEVQAMFKDAYSQALSTGFKVAGFISIAAFVASWFIKELPMRTTVTAEGIGEAFGMPRRNDSLAEIARAISVLVGRKATREYLNRLANEAGVDLPLSDCWVLLALRWNPNATRDMLVERARTYEMPPEVLDRSLDELKSRQMITDALQLTPTGEQTADRLSDAVRGRLEALLQGWEPDAYPDLARFLDHLSVELATSSAIEAGARPLAAGPR